MSPPLPDSATLIEELQSLQARVAQLECQARRLNDLLPIAAMVVSRDGRLMRMNPVAEAWFGAIARPGMRLPWLFGAGSTAAVQQAMAQALAGRDTQVPLLPSGLAAPAPEVVELRIMAHEASDEDERVLVLAFDHRRSDRRHSDAALLRALLDSSADLIYATDLQGRLLMANHAMGQLLGQPVAALLGRRREEIVPLLDIATHDRQDAQVTREGCSLQLREQFLAAQGGGPRSFQTQKFPVRGANGEVLGVGHVSRDITEEVESSVQRQLSERVFLNTADAIIATDAQGLIRRVNPAFERLSGLPAEAAVGRRLSAVQPIVQTVPATPDFWTTVRDEGQWGGELCSRSLDGRTYTVWCSVTAMRDERQQLMGYALVQSGLTELRLVQARAEELAATDQLTGLPNRLVMQDRLQQLVLNTARRQSTFALLFIDLDHFKEVNDSLGHHAGDQLLRTVAERLRCQVRAQDTVARLGGDEFVVLLPGADDDTAPAVARKLVAAVSLPARLENLDSYEPQMSIGVAVFPQDGDQAELLLRNADTAMYAAKAAGRNQVSRYNSAMSQAAAEFIDVQKALPEAIRRGELRLMVQPKFRLSDRTVVGGEALVRWDRPGAGLLEPAAFLPAATRGGLLPAIDEWMLAQAVVLLARWRARHWLDSGWRLSVNQAAQDLRQDSWLGRLQAAVAGDPALASHLEIELTEGQLAQPTPELMRNLHGLRTLGVRLSVDDFGTGYSSMAYLKSLPISAMKIDGGFVRDMLVDTNDHSLVEAMVTLGQKLGHETVAECVETEDQCRALSRLGCVTGQGHLLGPAMSIELFEQLHLPASRRA